MKKETSYIWFIAAFLGAGALFAAKFGRHFSKPVSEKQYRINALKQDYQIALNEGSMQLAEAIRLQIEAEEDL